MNLLSILVCLVSDQLLPGLNKVRDYTLFSKCFEILKQRTTGQWRRRAVFWLVAVILPALIIIALVQFILNHIMLGLLGIIFNLLVLFYCLGSSDLKSLFKDYFATKKQDAEASTQVAEQGAQALKVNKEILVHSQQQIFSILFFFLFFGAAGAIAYRLCLELTKYFAADASEESQGLAQSFTCYVQILDWIPVRLLGLCFSLAGNFAGGFTKWGFYVLSKPEYNEELLTRCAYSSMGLDPQKAISEEISLDDSEYQVIALIQRSFVIILAVLGLMTLASWIS